MLEQNLNGQPLDIVSDNVQKLKALFPEIVSEDKIDFEKLQAMGPRSVFLKLKP